MPSRSHLQQLHGITVPNCDFLLLCVFVHDRHRNGCTTVRDLLHLRKVPLRDPLKDVDVGDTTRCAPWLHDGIIDGEMLLQDRRSLQ
jgi:hypothetical protein